MPFHFMNFYGLFINSICLHHQVKDMILSFRHLQLLFTGRGSGLSAPAVTMEPETIPLTYE